MKYAEKIMTLQDVINQIGGNSEMLGTPLSADCLTESATRIAERDGYEIYRLACGDYFLSHECGSTHLVTADDLADGETAEARVVRAVDLAQ